MAAFLHFYEKGKVACQFFLCWDKPTYWLTKQQTNQASQLLVELRECELTFMGKIFLYFVKQKNYCMQLNR